MSTPIRVGDIELGSLMTGFEVKAKNPQTVELKLSILCTYESLAKLTAHFAAEADKRKFACGLRADDE